MNAVERAGLYVRISEQDKVKLTKAQLSKSIENQLKMLKAECMERNWIIVDVYCDEDISGADKTRPEFNRMLKDCENGKINVVLCKSQDRFARDIEIIEKYIHDKFIEWGVRFVTIVDHADSNDQSNKKNRQITGLTNEWYLEDLSNNIKKTFNTKRKCGDFVGSFAPYGYLKQRDMNNVIHLIIDPIASEIVKRIYNDYINGLGLRTIAKGLNDDKILSPSEYKWNNGEYINIPTKKYENTVLSKSGGYIIKCSYFNENLKSGTTINHICKIDCDNNLINNIELKLHKSNSLNIYYITENMEEAEILNSFNTDIWVKVDTVIPSNVKYIWCCYKVEKKYEELFTSFELNIEKNQDRSIIDLENFAYINSEKIYCFKKEIRYRSLWTKRTIENILFNPVYIGTLVQGKTTTVSYKNHTKIDLPKDKWHIVKNAHDPIIDIDTWTKVQDRKNKRLRCSQNKTVNNFSGILKCAYCGKTFISTKCGRSNDKNQVSYYVCTDRSTKFSNCINNKQIRKDELETITINEINKLITTYRDNEKIEELYNLCKLNDENYKSKLDALELEKKELLKSKLKNEKYSKELYESKLNGLIDTEEYFVFKNQYKEEIEKINERLFIIDNEINLIYEKRNKIKNKDSIIKKYNKIESLSYEIVHEFISEIKIGIKENNKRKIEFLWNF